MNAYITLDYELWMGNRTGTPEKCLVTPMDYLTGMLEKYGVKCNIFVDAAYLLQLRKLKDKYSQIERDYELVINHIKKLDSEGHSIHLHLHPQWCYSEYDGEKWIMDKNHYKLSDMPLNDQQNLIKEGVELLNSIVTRSVSAFRGGGYSVDHFEEIKDVFIKEGIVVDTSVLRGEFVKGKYQMYDYRKVPNKTSYRFTDNPIIEDEDGNMTEYPISTIVVPSFVYLLNKRKKHSEFHTINASEERWGDGQGIGYSGSKIRVLMKKVKMFFGKKAIRASIDIGEDLESVYSYSMCHYEGDDFVIIGHPKAISPYSISILEFFINNHPEINFTTFCH